MAIVVLLLSIDDRLPAPAAEMEATERRLILCRRLLRHLDYADAGDASPRSRYRKLGLSREDIIHALENHRRAQDRRQRPEGHWPSAVASFVVEHARNAGSTLYYLHFSHQGRLELRPDADPVISVPVGDVRVTPGGWLPEETPVLVVRDRIRS